MSKIALESNPSGTGTFTIKSPDSNVDRELVLPDEAGTVLTNDSDIEPQVKAATNASGSAPIYACRAWVNFDGNTSPGTIRASGNVSSVIRNGTGDYTVNFTTAMPDSNYVPMCASIGRNVTRGGYLIGPRSSGIADPQNSLSNTSVRIQSIFLSSRDSDASANDVNGVYFSVFR